MAEALVYRSRPFDSVRHGKVAAPSRGSANYGARIGGTYNPGYHPPGATICRSGYGCRTTFNYRSTPYYYGVYPYVWYPFYGWDSGNSSSPADSDSQQALADEQRRNAELAAALADQQDRESEPPPAREYQCGPPNVRDDTPRTILIFSNGVHAEIQNYAIMGDTLYDFSAQRTRKILLSQLDLYATIKANDDRGIEFRVPPKQQSQ